MEACAFNLFDLVKFMKTTKTLLAAAIFGLIAFAGYSQAQTATGTATPAASATPNPNAGTYLDNTLTIPQRLGLANAVLSSGTDTSNVLRAAEFMLDARPVLHLATLYPEFANTVLSDPTLGGKVAANSLWDSAVIWKAEVCNSLDDKIAYLSAKLTSDIPQPYQGTRVKSVYGSFISRRAQIQYDARDYAGAIETATPVLGYNIGSALPVVFKAKLALRSADVLSWAKLVYVTSDFSRTQAGIDAVSSAYRSLDTNLVRANAFIQYQKDGVGTNPLAGVTLPSVTLLGADDRTQALNLGIASNNVGALKIAATIFAAAPSGPALNNATAFVAQWLRNIDGNLIRANDFVSTQSQGQPYEIAELK